MEVCPSTKNSFTEIINSLIPEIAIDKFEFVAAQNNGEILNLFYKEKGVGFKDVAPENLKPKGFFPTITTHEFLFDNQLFYLNLKRRRWLNIDTRKEGFINWSLLKTKTRYESLFKEINIH